jgi:hypothetical protein
MPCLDGHCIFGTGLSLCASEFGQSAKAGVRGKTRIEKNAPCCAQVMTGGAETEVICL